MGTKTVHRTEKRVPWRDQFVSFVSRQLQASLRNRVALFWNFVWPVFWYLLTVNLIVLPGLPDSATADVIAVTKGTQAITYGIFGAVTATLVGFGAGLTRDLEAKRYQKLRSLPISPYADLIGRFTSGFLIGLGSFLLVVVVGLLDGAAFEVRGLLAIPIVLLSLALLCAVCMTVSLIVAVIVRDQTKTNMISLTIVLVAFFVTGYNGMQAKVFPAEDFQWLVNFLPNSLAARLQAYYLIDTNWELAGLAPPAMPSSLIHLLPMMAYTVIFLALAGYVMKRVIYGGRPGDLA